ncbi:hypothetical protein D3C71_1839830 [compost metagenome]
MECLWDYHLHYRCRNFAKLDHDFYACLFTFTPGIQVPQGRAYDGDANDDFLGTFDSNLLGDKKFAYG